MAGGESKHYKHKVTGCVVLNRGFKGGMVYVVIELRIFDSFGEGK